MSVNTYNTFVVVDCKSRKIELVTSSAKKANSMLLVGKRVEVWNRNMLVEKIYFHEKELAPMSPYLNAEKEFIGRKQKRRENRNIRRRQYVQQL